jgi:murein DD-endopeptidase MepM/ murein hydrolase activator NlpD
VIIKSAWRRRASTCGRTILAVLFIVLAVMAMPAPAAEGKQSPADIRDRLDLIQQDLDEAVARVEGMRARQQELLIKTGQVDEQIGALDGTMEELEARIVAAAIRLYKTSETSTLGSLLSSESFAELQGRSEALARLSELDASTLADYKAAESELEGLREDLMGKTRELAATRSRLDEESKLLQEHFQEVTDEYNTLVSKLAAARRAATQRAAKEQAGAAVLVSADGMTCPIAAPHSFIDSWGFPRSGGRTHEGADIMAAKGAPVVAVTNGTITFAGVGVTAGNWLILSGDDGHEYWYMHNTENLVLHGRVSVGRQIATVGDTGNAIGGPSHVHFEYHPGSGGPINPYPLLMDICRGGT